MEVAEQSMTPFTSPSIASRSWTWISRSPTMLCVTLRQLQRGKSLDLAACFRMELGMVAQCFEQGDLPEGVRALLIDKDNSPRWKPSRLEEVTDASIDAFFRERWSSRDHPLGHLEGASL